MAFSDPALGRAHLQQMALGAVLLGFSAATQDIVIDAYRIELAETQMQTVLASTYNAGYRIGMIVAGAGALFLGGLFGNCERQLISMMPGNGPIWRWLLSCWSVIITTLSIRSLRS